MYLQDILKSVQGLLDEHGVTASVQMPDLLDRGSSCRMICITGDLGTRRTQMKQQSRDNVMMVRVDDESIEALDSWIGAGVAASRSEAAALFIKEGLGLRGHELDQLRAPIDKVARAQKELREKARAILGDELDAKEVSP